MDRKKFRPSAGYFVDGNTGNGNKIITMGLDRRIVADSRTVTVTATDGKGLLVIIMENLNILADFFFSWWFTQCWN